DVFSTPIAFPAFVSTDEDSRKFLHAERARAQLAHFRFDVRLQHAHGSHHDDDGKNTNRNAEEGKCGTQLMSDQRAHRHEEAFAQFSTQTGGPGAANSW